MAEGAAREVEWPEEDGAPAEGSAAGEGAGALPGMDSIALRQPAAPRSSISFADPPKKRFF